MSSLGPDGTFVDDLDERSASRVHASPFAARGVATDVSAAPLWMAFRDYYTRAKERRSLAEEGGRAIDHRELSSVELLCDCL